MLEKGRSKTLPTDLPKSVIVNQASAREYLIAAENDNEGGVTFRGGNEMEQVAAKGSNLKIQLSDNSDYDEETGRETPHFAKRPFSENSRGKTKNRSAEIVNFKF